MPKDAVLAPGGGNEAVVGRVEHRRVEEVVNEQLLAGFAQLVLDRRMAGRDLNDGIGVVRILNEEMP
ncbi:hypothetical protein MCN99_05955 [Pseudomonas aeruginosa]|nr:hypothetical protein [Pseudomonas aeruginosa]UKW03310.1 hypothetical protein MCN99_05955 [Pseudomonas aeruginosa]